MNGTMRSRWFRKYDTCPNAAAKSADGLSRIPFAGDLQVLSKTSLQI